MSYSFSVSATEIIEQFKALPPSERAQVAKFVVEHDDSWIPESSKQGMEDAEAGRYADMETVLTGVERHGWANRQIEWSFWEKRHRRQSREGSGEEAGTRPSFK